MAKVTFIKTKAESLAKVPIKEGQIIFLSDGAVYADIDASTRVSMGTSIVASDLTNGLMSSGDKIKLNFLTYDKNSDTVTFA